MSWKAGPDFWPGDHRLDGGGSDRHGVKKIWKGQE